MATQTIFLTGSETFVGSPADDDFVITDNGVGSNTVTLGNGDDQLTLGNGGSNTLSLGDGADQLTIGGPSNTITTGNGNSQITTTAGINTITVGTGSNTITLDEAASGSPDIVHTGAGGNTVFVTAAAVSGDTLFGAQLNGDGTTNKLVLTTAGTMSPLGVSGFQTYQLADGGANNLTLSDANFGRLPGGSITVIGGDSGNTINASALVAAHSVTFDAGAGIDALTGGAGDDRFIFAAGNTSGDTVDGGLGSNTLELAAGGAGILNGLGTSVVNIAALVLDAGAAWTIDISDSAAFTGTVSGFVASDNFDLTNVAFDSAGSANLLAGNVLQIVENASTFTVQLNAAADFTGDTFHLATDGVTGTLVSEATAACFCRGTLIRTALGEVPVEQLAIGDLVMLVSGEAQAIRWIGRRRFDGRFIAGKRAVLPIRIAAGALADGVPVRDLWLSPGHALAIDGVLVQVEHLVNGATIVQAPSVEQVEYFNIEFDAHQVILAEGAPVESYVDCDNRLKFANAAQYALLYPEDDRPRWQFCAPRLQCGAAELTAIRAALLRRAEALGHALDLDPDLHLIVDGEIVRPGSVADRVYRFAIPAGSATAWLASRSTVPAETVAASSDNRRLGVPVERLALYDCGLALEAGHNHAALCDGFHKDEASHRWTTGLAQLPAAWLRAFPGALTLEVQLRASRLGYRPPAAAAPDAAAA